ncbi:hypothetical protein [uncultured Alistipes sp.]|jgi:tetratricopeptide (TPR) repeat protein|uniref:tetratricopeptide repeat protein n=2 Tax=uncultured Alistipes sp. TaxID=538949 RepID=UPI00322075C2
MKAMMKHTSVGLLAVLLAGCSVTSHLERRQSRALAEYALREQAAPKPAEKRNYMTMRHDSTTYYIAEAVKDENGETMAEFRLDEVVVVAKSRTLSERKGKVLVDFVVKLPKELQGGCRSIVVVPHLHKAEGAVPLQEISIRGGLFSRVQDRNYWQFSQYVRLFRPDAAGEQWAFERFVKHPYPQGVRLDSIVEGARDLSYYYSQEVPTRSEGKTMLLTLHGAVVALDGSRYDLPPLDTLRYHISSMLSFADTTTRYVTKIIEKYAVVNNRNYLSFRVNDTRIIDTLGDNAVQLARIESLMSGLVEQREFHVDSIVLTASASPEGSYAQNERLARGRAAVLKQRLGQRFGLQVDTLLSVRWVAEDWVELERRIAADSTIAEREAILGLLRTVGNPDRREAELRRRFPKQYRDIRERLYPLLRAVNFKYDLRRVGMVKDTIHTTVPDTLYARGVELLNEREYNDALRILRPYEDRNTAVAMLSLGYDEQAYEVLRRLSEEATVEYLKAIACARMGRIEEGKAAFRRACELQPNFEYRGNLDPEIRELITTQ